MAGPVDPTVVGVSDLGTLAAELGLTVGVRGHGTYDLVLHDGLRAEVVDEAETDGDPAVLNVCAADIEAAITTVCDHYNIDPVRTAFTIDPETMRTRGVLIHTPSLLVSAVHCSAAEGAGVPCSTDCSPHKNFNT